MSFNPLTFTLFFFEVPVFPFLPHLIGGLLNVHLSVALSEQFRKSLPLPHIRFLSVVCDVTLYLLCIEYVILLDI